MGILDRDYTQERIRSLEDEARAEKVRRASYDPKQHRRRSNPSGPSSSPSRRAASGTPRPSWWQANRWSVVGFVLAIAFTQWLGLGRLLPSLLHRAPPAVVTPPPVLVGPTARLHIVAGEGAGLTSVDLTDVVTHGSWSFKLSSGQTIDYGMPPGDYRVRITANDKWGPAGKPNDMPEIAHFAVGPHGESGTWTVSVGNRPQ